jgi:TetR/AcrR family transcriptional repressor of nem operon
VWAGGAGAGRRREATVAPAPLPGCLNARVDSVDDLYRWRDIIVEMMRGLGCAGCRPIGTLANELCETDPLAHARLARSFAQWETMIHEGLVSIAGRCQLATGTDIDRIAPAMLAAI